MYTLFIKDLKLFIKDRRSVLLSFLLPILLISLFVFAYGGVGTHKTQARKLLVVDLDKSEASKQIIADLKSVKELKIYTTDLAQSQKDITHGKYAAALILHTSLNDSVQRGGTLPLEMIYDREKEMEVGMLQPLIINSLMEHVGKQVVQNKVRKSMQMNFPYLSMKNIDEILAKMSQNDDATDVGINIEMHAVVGQQDNKNLALIQAVAGTAIMMLLFSIAGLATGILEEKEKGTLKRLLQSPIHPNTILWSKMLFAFFISVVQLSVMFIFAWAVFGLDITRHLVALILMILASGFAVSSVGILLASVAKTRQQAQSLGTLVILVMSAIGGSMIPLFVMPAIMKKIAVISINYWGIQGFYDIFWRSLPLSEILPKIFLLFGIGIVLSLLSVRFFHKNVIKS